MANNLNLKFGNTIKHITHFFPNISKFNHIELIFLKYASNEVKKMPYIYDTLFIGSKNNQNSYILQQLAKNIMDRYEIAKTTFLKKMNEEFNTNLFFLNDTYFGINEGNIKIITNVFENSKYNYNNKVILTEDIIIGMIISDEPMNNAVVPKIGKGLSKSNKTKKNKKKQKKKIIRRRKSKKKKD